MMAASRKRVDRLKWLIQHGHIPAEYEDLGERIILLSERKQRETYPVIRMDGGAGGSKGDGAFARLTARQRWEQMFEHIGPDGEAVVSAVIVEGMTTEDAAKALNVHAKAVIPLLKLALGAIGRKAA